VQVVAVLGRWYGSDEDEVSNSDGHWVRVAGARETHLGQMK
jgi:hypothetical protein